MTTIFSEDERRFLQLLDDNPEFRQEVRRRLLGQELMELPERFAELVQIVRELTARFDAFAEETNRRLTTLETDVATLKTDVGTLKTDVGTLKTNVGTLIGNDTERQVRENILNIARDELGLTRGRILLARGRDTDPRLLSILEAAEEQGLITERQTDHVMVADIIIRARRVEDRQYVHAVFEVSRTIKQDDIERARDRAATIAAATGEDAVAAVVGKSIQPQQKTQAKAMSVRVILPAMFGPDEPETEDHNLTC